MVSAIPGPLSSLNSLRARFLEQARGVHEGLLRAGLVRTERHVDDHEGALRAAHHGLGMQNHHVERDANGIGQAVDHHADAVADQQDIAVRIHDGGHGGAIGGQADERGLALAGADVGGGQAFDRLGLAAQREYPCIG